MHSLSYIAFIATAYEILLDVSASLEKAPGDRYYSEIIKLSKIGLSFLTRQRDMRLTLSVLSYFETLTSKVKLSP